MIDVEPLIVSELERMLPLPDGRRADWADVAQRAGVAVGRQRWRRALLPRPRSKPRRWRPVLVTVVAAIALAGAGVAIAAGLGAFKGINAAQHPPTPADRLDPAVRAFIARHNKLERQQQTPFELLKPNSARLVRQLPDGMRVYVVTTTTGDLCGLVERLHALHASNLKKGAFVVACDKSLTQKVPTTIEAFKANQESPVFSWGVTLDGVTAVSWRAGRKEVVVPVKDNVWVHQGNASFVDFTVHFSDGRTQTIP